jgi:hypothetical protein
MGLFGGSSRSSSDTTNTDNRISQQGGTAVSGLSAGDNFTLSVTDGGAVAAAFDAMALNDATNSQNFTNLLDLAGGFFDKSERLIGQTQSAVADAYGQAQTVKTGAIDQKTIIVLAVVGAVAIFLIIKAKK